MTTLATPFPKRRNVRRIAVTLTTRTILYAIALAGALTMILPFVWMLVTSVRPADEMYAIPFRWLPSQVSLDAYGRAWKTANFALFMWNSLVMALGITLGRLVVCAMAAYAFARLRFPFRDGLFVLYLGTMMIPSEITLIPSYLVVSKLGWANTFQALIVPGIASAFGTFMLRQFFISIPSELEDAALVDGCNRLQVLWHVFIPLTRGALATLGVFSFMAGWNAFLWPLIVTSSNNMKTVQIGLAVFRDQMYGIIWGELMAASVLVTLPVLVVFLFAQRQLIEGMARSGLKG